MSDGTIFMTGVAVGIVIGIFLVLVICLAMIQDDREDEAWRK